MIVNAEGRYPLAHLQVSCEPVGQRLAQWGKALAIVAMPPFVVPALLALLWVSAIGLLKWLVAGFRVDPNDEVAPVTNALPLKSQEAAKALGQHHESANGDADDKPRGFLQSSLSWSVFAATAIEYVARSILDTPLGTSVLWFAALGVLAYVAGRLGFRLRRYHGHITLLALLAFWSSALLILVTGLSR